MALRRITVHAGDFRAGQLLRDPLYFYGRKRWHIALQTPKSLFRREKIPLSEIAILEVASSDTVNRLGGAIGWGIAGDALLGPVGLLAGLLRGGRGNETTFVCRFKDGRKFLGTTSSSVFGIIRNSVAGAELNSSSFSSDANTNYPAPSQFCASTSADADQRKWEALLKYDKDVAAAVAKIQHLGPDWIDELKDAFLALNDKSYLQGIVEDIIEEACQTKSR